jgi:hypothetical protein
LAAALVGLALSSEGFGLGMNFLMRLSPACRASLLYFFVSLGAGLLMVSSQSLWIDEGLTWLYARESSIRGWMGVLLSDRGSQAQMPFGMFAAWVAGNLFGLSEWQLRSVNVLWIALAGTAMGRLGQALRLPSLLPLFLVQPFVWYYANEARPYALMICVSAWLVALWALVHHERTLSPRRLWATGAFATVGMGCSLLFSFGIAGFALALGATVLVRNIPLDRRHVLPITTTALAMAALMAYYAWTLARGVGGAKIWSVGVSNVAFGFYELLGFGGLGPPRNELREAARGSGQIATFMLQGGYAVGVVLLVASYLTLIPSIWKIRRDSLSLIAAGALMVSTGALLAASVVVKFPFWGRHLAFSLPVVALLISKTQAAIQRVRLRYFLTFSLFGILLVSSLRQRFLPQYGKDDYRSASRMAAAALGSGKNVWWVADPNTARYYGVRAPGNEAGAGGIWFSYENEGDPQNKPAPDLIFVSKPDIYDSRKMIRSYIEQHAYQPSDRVAAFQIYARNGGQK